MCSVSLQALGENGTEDKSGVSERHWAFRGELLVDQAQLKGMERAELEFESLDTFATIYLVSRAQNEGHQASQILW